MNTQGVHLLCEMSGCDVAALSDLAAIQAAMKSAASAANVEVMDGFFHAFAPSGVTGLLCLSESHFSIHTWPEHGYAAADLYTCGDAARPSLAMETLAKALKARDIEVRTLERGVWDDALGRFRNRDFNSK